MVFDVFRLGLATMEKRTFYLISTCLACIFFVFKHLGLFESTRRNRIQMPLYNIDKMLMKQAISGSLEDNFQHQMSICAEFCKICFSEIA